MKQKPIPLARSGLITPIIKFLSSNGIAVDLYLNKVKIPLSVLEESEILIPLPMALKFISKTAKAEGIENLGIAIGKAAKITDTGMFGVMICQSFNVYDLVKRICQFSSNVLSQNGEQFWLIEQEDYIWFCQKFVKPLNLIPGIDHSNHYSIALMLDCLRLALGDRWQPPDIYLATPPYKGFEEKIDIGNTRLHYQKPFNAICIPRKYLRVPVDPSLSKNTAYYKSKIKEWEDTTPALDFVKSVEQTIKSLLLEQYPTIDITAEASGLSVRTLQRYLSEHNLTYSRLMDKVRYELALSSLNNPDVSLLEISYTLGFTDPANFSHAFKRWTGISPSKFRSANIKN